VSLTIATGTVTLLFKPAPFLDTLDLLLGTAPEETGIRRILFEQQITRKKRKIKKPAGGMNPAGVVNP